MQQQVSQRGGEGPLSVMTKQGIETEGDASSIIFDVGPNDVLLGRGPLIYRNPGNDAFRKLCQSRHGDYVAAGRDADSKHRIAKEIVTHVLSSHDSPGRFLCAAGELGTSLPPRKSKAWRCADIGDALEKVKQTMRDIGKSQRMAPGSKSKRKEVGDLKKAKEQSAEGLGGPRFESNKGKTPSLSGGTSPRVTSDLEVPLGLKVVDPNRIQETTTLYEADIDVIDHISSSNELGCSDPPSSNHLLDFVEPTPFSDDSPLTASAPAVTALQRDVEITKSNQVPSQRAGPRSESGSNLLDFVRSALEMAKSLVAKHCIYNDTPDSPVARDDLHALGKAFYQSLAGFYPMDVQSSTDVLDSVRDNDDEQRPKRDRLSVGGYMYVPLKDKGFPIALSLLVDSLLAAKNLHSPDRFRSAVEVEEDLRLMTSDPGRYLFDPTTKNGGYGGNRSPSTGRLYGMDEAQAQLLETYQNVIVSGRDPRGLVVISGRSGTGKSSLVSVLQAPLTERRGTMISCKFNAQEQPMTVLFRAFEEYCRDLLNGDQNVLVHVRSRIISLLGPNTDILAALIPNITAIIGDAQGAGGINVNSNSFQRTIYSLRMFIRAIAAPAHPAIVFFDDLQWADKSCLDLVAMLTSDTESSALLFLACYRDNEISSDTMSSLDDIVSSGIPVSTLSLSNLDKASANALVSDTLQLSPRLSRALSDAIHAKTGGNPLFIVQLIKSFYDERLLRYSVSSCRWEWDIDKIQDKSIASSALGLLLSKMKESDLETQFAVSVASCLGFSFDARTLGLLVPNGEARLEALSADGLLIRGDGDNYRFAHDQIWEASYALTPESEQDNMHVTIGRQLLGKADPLDSNVRDGLLYTIVDQLNRGSCLIVDQDEKIKAAELNLKVGDKALAACSFLQASVYLLQGCVFLSENDWETNYDLSLGLFSACAEAQIACGNNDGAIVSAESVLTHGKTVDDRLRGWKANIAALINEDRKAEALYAELSVLEQLEEEIPMLIEPNDLHNEKLKLTHTLQSVTIVEVLGRSALMDDRKVAAMRLLMLLVRTAYAASPAHFVLAVIRIIEISMTYGLTPESSFGFAAFALVISVGQTDNNDVADHCSGIAHALLRRFDNKYDYAVDFLLSMSISPFRQPMQAVLDGQRQARKAAMAAGDTMWGCSIVSLIGFQTATTSERGKDLKDVEMELQSHMQELSSQHDKHPSRFVASFLQYTLNLRMPKSSGGDPTMLTGEVMDYDEAIAAMTESGIKVFLNMVSILNLILAYQFRRYDLAEERLAHVQERFNQHRPSSYEQILFTFYGGLVATALLRSNKDERDREMLQGLVQESLCKLTRWAEEDSKWNFQHKLDLVSAEVAFIGGDTETAAEAYNASIMKAGEHGFINEQALAAENAGLFYLDQGNLSEAEKYLETAYALCISWGAVRKADDLRVLVLDCQNRS